jgi:glycosyltransferase involved in cell wall biosynthesis
MARIVVHDYTGHPFQIQLSRQLARRGHPVMHAFSADFQTPKGDLVRRETDPDTLTIAPIALGNEFAKQRYVKRRFQELEYARRAARLFDEFRPDVVISANTPTEAQAVIQRGARRAGAAFVFWMQDIYSIAVERLLSKRSRMLGKAIGWRYRQIERATLRESDATVVISPDFQDVLGEWGIDRSRVTTIPNWAPLGEITPRPKDNDWARQHGLANERCFVYSGTLGLKHQPHLLSELARRVAPIPVVVISEGIGAQWLDGERTRASITNLKLLPFQPYQAMSEVFATADVLVALLERDAGMFSVPSKILSYMCAERALLAAVPPENLSARIVTGSGAGRVVQPDDLDGFCREATALMGDAEARRRHARCAQDYARVHFEIDQIATRFETVVDNAAGSRRH